MFREGAPGPTVEPPDTLAAFKVLMPFWRFDYTPIEHVTPLGRSSTNVTTLGNCCDKMN